MDSTINKLRKVVYVAVEFTTGLVDLVVAVRKPNGDLLAPAPVVSEQGEGVYVFEYTPDAVGVWQEKVSSAVNGDKAVRSVKIVSADTSDVKVQTQSIEDKVDGVDAKVTTVDGKVDGVDAKVTTVDGKVTAVGVDVDAVGADVDAVKAKTDNLPADTASELNTIKSKIDGVSTEIKPGGYFA